MTALISLCKVKNKDHGAISNNLHIQSFSLLEIFTFTFLIFWPNSVTQLYIPQGKKEISGPKVI